MSMSSDSQEFTLSPFDQALIESGYLSLSQIHQALLECRHTGAALPKVVEAIIGESLPAELHRQYAAQQRFALTVIHGVTFFDQDQLTPLVADKTAIARLINQYLPLPLCRQYGFLPLHHPEASEALLVAMIDPSDEEAYQFLDSQLSPHQLTVQRRGIMREDYDALLDQLYGDQALLKIIMASNEAKTDPRSPATVVEVTEVIEEMPPQIAALQNPSEPPPQPSSPAIADAEDKQVVQLVNKILILGLREGADEIHINPEENQVLVHIRQGGNLRLLMEPIPTELGPAIVRRSKVMTNLDVNQTDIPQKGRLRKSYNGRPAYFFINTLPSFYGEKVLVRIVPGQEKLPELTELSHNRQVQSQIQELAQAVSGLVVIAGPTYGGKSTTLEALLGQQLKRNLAVGSVEDPIRHTHQGITQVVVNQEHGFTAAKAITALLDQRLDVIAVDGLTEGDTIPAVVNALNQGRLVFLTLAAKDAAMAIAQLQQSFSPAVLGEYLRGVVAQRLIRRVCRSCRLKTDVSPDQQQRYGLPGGSIYQANSLSPEVMQQAGIKQRLCQQCHGVGYVGVSGVFEVVPMMTSLQQIIRRPCPAADLRLAFQQTGITTLPQAAIALVGEGITSLEEVNRVFPQMPDVAPPTPMAAPPATPGPLPPDLMARVQSLEHCVTQLNQSLAELKQAITPKAPAAPPPEPPPAPKPEPKPAPTPTPSPTLDLLPELEALENLSSQKRSQKGSLSTDDESTLIRDFADIEELSVDGDVPELDAKEATWVGEVNVPPTDDQDPFKTAMDPW
ncbi:MAG: ATPase, T2SS/T4P/T4SS family [Synechocystis sp.]|nr:ATPase, T2SS/T4P/T4SS family [Synechocystis sp.]